MSMVCSLNELRELPYIENDDDLLEFDIEKMKSLAERINFSLKKEHESAIKVNKWTDVAYYETLCKYVSDNEINVMLYSARDFDAAVEILETYGQYDKSVDYYYFWINHDDEWS